MNYRSPWETKHVPGQLRTPAAEPGTKGLRTAAAELGSLPRQPRKKRKKARKAAPAQRGAPVA